MGPKSKGAGTEQSSFWRLFSKSARTGCWRLSEADLCNPPTSLSLAQTLKGDHGIAATVSLPPDAELNSYERVELDFALGCNGD